VCGASFAVSDRTFLLFWRCLTIAKQELLINDEIREKEVRVIDSDGAQLGIISLKEALAIAAEKNLDLVEIAPTANPHVCRIMDYGKYKFEQVKREKEAKKNQKVIEVKEIRLSLNIDTNDFNTKLKQAIKFLKDGNKVKVSVRFRGREMAHPELGTEMVQKFADGVAEFGSVDKMPKLEGRSMVMIISSKTGK
jgi:translation initiation factor IF-3